MLVEVKIYEEIGSFYKGRFEKVIKYMKKNKIMYAMDTTSSGRKVIATMMTFKQIKKMYKKVGPDLLGAVIF